MRRGSDTPLVEPWAPSIRLADLMSRWTMAFSYLRPCRRHPHRPRRVFRGCGNGISSGRSLFLNVPHDLLPARLQFGHERGVLRRLPYLRKQRIAREDGVVRHAGVSGDAKPVDGFAAPPLQPVNLSEEISGMMISAVTPAGFDDRDLRLNLGETPAQGKHQRLKSDPFRTR